MLIVKFSFAVGGFFLLGDFFKSLYCVLDRLAYGFFGGNIILFIVNFAVGGFFLLGYFFKSLYCLLDRLAYSFFGSSVILFIFNFSFTVGGFFLLGDFLKSLYCLLDRLACIKIENALINRHIYIFNFFIILYNRRHFCKLLNCICYRSGCHYPLFEQHLFRHSGLLVKILLNCRYCG